jgi:thiamine kinase-like enzyme
MAHSIKDLEGITPLEAGRTNTSYVLDFKNAKSILRVSKEETHVHVIDRPFEQEIFIQASDALLAPKVLATGKNFIITEFYENQNTRDAMSSIQMIIPVLSSFYEAMSKQESRAPVFEDVLQERMRRAHECDVKLPDNYRALEDVVKETITSPEYLALPRALCHLDLTPRNVLFGAKGIKFIDFEMANWGPRLLDLASISVGYGLDDRQEKELVGRYYDKSPQAMGAFYKTKLCYHFRCVLWLLMQSKIEESQKWRESDSKDLVVDINKAFDCIEKISRIQRGRVHGKSLLPRPRNCRP